LFATLLGRLFRLPAPSGLGRALHYAAAGCAFLFAFSFLLPSTPSPALVAHRGLLLMLAILVALAALATKWVPDRFTRFSILWAVGTLGIYGWAQEKVPWLLVPMVLPLGLVAATWYREIIESGALLRPPMLLSLAGLSALSLWSMVAVSYLYDAPNPRESKEARHAEMLVYVQSTYDITDRVMRTVEEVAAKLGTGTRTRLAVSGNATWPLSWYLRHYPVNWAADIRNVDTPIVIVDREVTALDKPLAEKYRREIFEIRGWWEPDWRSLDLPKLVRWLFTRVAWNGNGSSDGLMYVYRQIEPGMTIASVAVNPPPAPRSYPAVPTPLESVAVWGRHGMGLGEFREPRDIALDAAGNLYVVDSGNDRIQKLSPTGQPLTAWGSEGSEAGQFKDPCGVAVGPDGAVYVADTWNHRIQKFDSNGRYLLEWREDDPGFWGPRGVAVAADGTVYVTDTGNKRVLAYTSEGRRLRVWGKEGSRPGEFIEPVGIAIDAQGRIVVADTGNRRLQFFDASGKFLEEWQVFGWEEFYTEPYVDVFGDVIFVTDSFNHRFARYAGNRKLTGVWGKTGSGWGDFNRPIGIAVDPSGAVYIADTMNHRIQKFAPGL